MKKISLFGFYVIVCDHSWKEQTGGTALAKVSSSSSSYSSSPLLVQVPLPLPIPLLIHVFLLPLQIPIPPRLPCFFLRIKTRERLEFSPGYLVTKKPKGMNMSAYVNRYL